MKKLYGFLALAGMAAGSAWGQNAMDADSIARAKALLHSASWSDKAWGAYFSTGLRSGELSDALIEELRLAKPIPDGGSPLEFAYEQSLLDALIQSGKVVPAGLALPFGRWWRAEVLILLSRDSRNEEPLLALRKTGLTAEEWLAVSNLLFRMRSNQFFASILQEKTLTHTFGIQDQDTGGFGTGAGPGPGGGECGDDIVGFPKGFPPIGKYQITLTPQAGDVVLAEGPKNVYYRRIVAPKDGRTTWRVCEVAPDPEARLTEYFGAIGLLDVNSVRILFQPADAIRWQNAEQVESDVKARLQAQVAAIREFVRTAGERGWSGASGVSLRIMPVVYDNRRNAHEALPAVAPVEFTLE
jgi:hypothetical protein